MTEDSELNEQVEYYRERAAEYDQWHARQGRYDRGEEHRGRWNAELEMVRAALRKESPLGHCLELACGTGLWTHHLADLADSLTAIDAVHETININRSKLTGTNVNYQVADLFEWWPTEQYDFVFFGFWMSHVPLERFNRFWEVVRASLKPGGKALFVDSLSTQESAARNHTPFTHSGVEERKLNDGRIFNIVKVFHTPSQLHRQLQDLGWAGDIEATGQFFYYGSMTFQESGQ